jgi:hypothetical protein
MAITDGNEQSTSINSEFGTRLGVTVTDSLGAPVGGGVVDYTPAKHNPSGYPQGPRTVTSWDGTASMPFFAGPTPGSYRVTVKGAKGSKAVFTETNLP